MSTLIAKLTPVRPETVCFDQALLALQTAGLTFEYPGSESVFEWRNGEGQYETSVAEVLRRAKSGAEGNVQMWFDDGDDLFVAWSADEMSLYFDGTSPGQQELCLDAILSLTVGANALWTIWVGPEDEA